MKRLFIVANPSKRHVATALAELAPWLQGKAEITGIEIDDQFDLAAIEADFILVLGGDGTLLGAARRLAGRQLPLMGVNFGRLGFLAGFTPANFRFYLQMLLADDDDDGGEEGFVEEASHLERGLSKPAGLPIRAHVALEVSVLPPEAPCRSDACQEVARYRRFSATALNDAVVTAGPPFHMVELELAADGEAGIRYFGDGVIVSTASGSTAYNVSAGGPIINADVEAFCITPICPHSLTFRPVVISSRSTVRITASSVNEGTTLFCDGQAGTRLMEQEKVVVRRSDNPVLLVENPDARPWRSLAEKLNWAVGPRYSEMG